MLMFIAGWIILFLTPAVPYRSSFRNTFSQKELDAMSREEKINLDRKDYERDIEKAKADKTQILGYTMVYGGLVLAGIKLIADAIAIRRGKDDSDKRA